LEAERLAESFERRDGNVAQAAGEDLVPSGLRES